MEKYDNIIPEDNSRLEAEVDRMFDKSDAEIFRIMHKIAKKAVGETVVLE